MELSDEQRRDLSFVSHTAIIEAAPARVFAIIEDPALVSDLMPRFLQAELVKGPWMMREGERIEMRLHFWGRQLDWQLEVTEYVRGERIVHRLEAGPLPEFEHRQLVQTTETGGTRLVDLVQYRVRFGLLGRLFDRVVLRTDVERILVHRAARLRQMLAAGAPD